MHYLGFDIIIIMIFFLWKEQKTKKKTFKYFCENWYVFFRIIWWIESWKEQYLFEI